MTLTVKVLEEFTVKLYTETMLVLMRNISEPTIVGGKLTAEGNGINNRLHV